jgi:hypothetical protein
MMAQAPQESLQMLSVNKTVVFCSPLETKEVLVRTGTIGEGSCLFHALLHAYSKDYVAMSREGRMKFVRRLRASMAGRITESSWEELGDGVISRVPFQESVLKLTDDLYAYLHSPTTDIHQVKGRSMRRLLTKLQKNLENYEIIPELLPLSVLFDTCLTDAYKKSENKKIDDTSQDILDEIQTHLANHSELVQLESERVQYILSLVRTCFEELLKEAKKSAFRSYIKGLERVTEDTDSSTIEFISERFKRDIYFLDGTSRMPYNICPTDKNLKNRKSMIIIWVGGNHYEIVGRLLPGNRVQREFSPDDPLINKIRTFLLNPEAIPRLYPELSTFIPEHSINDDENSTPITNSVTSPSLMDTYYDSSDDQSD